MNKIVETHASPANFKIPKNESEISKNILKCVKELEKKIDDMQEKLRVGLESLDFKVKAIEKNFEILFQDASSL